MIFLNSKRQPPKIGEDITHYHVERNPQGKGNVLLFPSQNIIQRRIKALLHVDHGLIEC